MPINNTSVNSTSGHLLVTVPKQSTYRIDEGKYAAPIKSVRILDKQNSLGSIPFVRIQFKVRVPGLDEQFDCLAKADFPLNLESGSDLRNVINRLLGNAYLANLSGKKFDLAALVGVDCEIEVEHVSLEGRENYDYPLVVVRDIQVPGTMTLTQARNVKDKS
jgi:hypothetical protein